MIKIVFYRCLYINYIDSVIYDKTIVLMVLLYKIIKKTTTMKIPKKIIYLIAFFGLLIQGNDKKITSYKKISGTVSHYIKKEPKKISLLILAVSSGTFAIFLFKKAYQLFQKEKRRKKVEAVRKELAEKQQKKWRKKNSVVLLNRNNKKVPHLPNNHVPMSYLLRKKVSNLLLCNRLDDRKKIEYALSIYRNYRYNDSEYIIRQGNEGITQYMIIYHSIKTVIEKYFKGKITIPLHRSVKKELFPNNLFLDQHFGYHREYLLIITKFTDIDEKAVWNMHYINILMDFLLTTNINITAYNPFILLKNGTIGIEDSTYFFYPSEHKNNYCIDERQKIALDVLHSFENNYSGSRLDEKAKIDLYKKAFCKSAYIPLPLIHKIDPFFRSIRKNPLISIKQNPCCFYLYEENTIPYPENLSQKQFLNNMKRLIEQEIVLKKWISFSEERKCTEKISSKKPQLIQFYTPSKSTPLTKKSFSLIDFSTPEDRKKIGETMIIVQQNGEIPFVPHSLLIFENSFLENG